MPQDKNILILDDDRAVRVSMKGFFVDYGYEVYVAKSTKEGKSIIESVEIDLALVDLRLPDKNGFEFIRMSYPTNPNTAFIIYTGSLKYDVPEEVKNLSQVANKIYIKPLQDLNIFIEKMKEIQNNL